VEPEALYDRLEQDIVPSFYERNAGRLPRRWVARMKSSIAALHHFNTQRMVKEYASDFYVTAHARSQQLIAEGAERAKVLAAWNSRMRAHWGEIRIEGADAVPGTGITVGHTVRILAGVRLGSIGPGDVAVELYLGKGWRRRRDDQRGGHSHGTRRRALRDLRLRSGERALPGKRFVRLHGSGAAVPRRRRAILPPGLDHLVKRGEPPRTSVRCGAGRRLRFEIRLLFFESEDLFLGLEPIVQFKPG